MKLKAYSWILSLLIIVTAITIQARDIKQVKVFIDDKTMLESLQSMSLDIVERGDNYIVIITNSTRSEEHTSELQSHSFISYAVFCLKKKKFFFLSSFSS